MPDVAVTWTEGEAIAAMEAITAACSPVDENGVALMPPPGLQAAGRKLEEKLEEAGLEA